MNFSQIRKLWGGLAKKHYWGDDMDVRYLLCEELNNVQSQRILDLGCSVGVILNCADNSNEKIGIDTSEESIRKARKISEQRGWDANYIKEDIFDYSAKKKFDIVILANIIEMVPAERRNELMKKITTFLKSNGILYLTTPNRGHPYFGKSKLTRKELEPYLEEFNYEVIAFNPFPLWLNKIVRYIPGWTNLLKYLSKERWLSDRSAGLMVIGKVAK